MTIASPRRALAASLLALASCAGPAADPAPRVRGPIPTRILQPAGLIFPAHRPRRATLLERGTGRVTPEVFYASIFERAVEPGSEANFDG